MKRLFYPAVLLCLSLIARSQNWVQMMQDPNANFYEVCDAFEAYWSTHDPSEKGKGYKAFKRWEYFVGQRVYPSGDLSLLQQTGKNFEAWREANMAAQATGKKKGGSAQIASATFTAMGPFGAISGQAGNQFLKSGRLNFITINPTDPNDLWVGAPSGGLWHSTDGGLNWTTNTDDLAVTGCSDLAIDPTNTLVMYMATGDGDGGDNRSIGVLKSTNAGQTWTTTGLTSNVSTYFLIRRLIINPLNPQILLAATNQGIYRTIDGGISWTVVSNANTFDLEFKPGNPNIVYAGGNSFRVSTNGGASFAQVPSTNGITTNAARMAVAVTPADSNLVYVVAGSNSNNGFQGLYRSTNSGSLFTVMSTTPNLLGWNSSGTDVGGQAWYDLCIAASPLNKDEVVVGGVNVWRSLNGGSSWSIYGHWTGNNAPFTHADHHDLEYHSNGTLYDVNDGTVYRRTATGWQEICGTMNIAQIYKLGLSSLTPNKWISGHQDNGTSVFDGTIYDAAIGGDGMDCFIHRTNDNIMFGETQYGGLRKSINGGQTWQSCKTGLPSTNGPWVTVWKQDPVNPDTLYCGYDNLYRSNNLAGNWGTLAPIPSGSSINEFAIAPSNNQVIYVAKNSGIYKTTNGGASWSTVTNGVPVNLASPRYICIDPNDEDNAWVVLSGYSAGNKVYMTTNGGVSWVNWTANLPNLPANCCVYHPGSSDRIYVGMDVGIYYRDANSGSWTLYNQGLPNVPISELEISPANPTMLYAATYGRGVWVASLESLAPAPPVTNFGVTSSVKCTNSAITFTDMSTNAPTSWSWSITPSSGYSVSSLTASNMVVNFSSTGTYTVSLLASNSLGTGGISTKTFVVVQSPTVSLLSNVQTSICAGSPVSFTASGATSYTWVPGGGSASQVTFYPQSSVVYTLTGFNNGCPATAVKSVQVQQGPTLSISGQTLICEGETLVLTASGSNTYTWNTGPQSAQISVMPSSNTTYSVSSIGSNGCKSSKIHQVSVYPIPHFTVSSSITTICEGESVNLFAAGADSFTWQPGGAVGYTTTEVLTEPTTFTIYGVDHRGCKNTTNLFIDVVECLSVVEHLGENIIQTVFPNPFSSTFFVDAGDLNSDIYFTLTDYSGRVIERGNYRAQPGSLQQFDLRNYSEGMYFLNLINEGKVQSVRLIKSF